jgi:hypothetical protein
VADSPTPPPAVDPQPVDVGGPDDPPVTDVPAADPAGTPHPPAVAAPAEVDLDLIERELRDVETALAQLADGTYRHDGDGPGTAGGSAS